VNTRDGNVGQPTDREQPSLGQGATRPREFDQVSIHGSHQGLRLRPRQQAGHMTASDRQLANAKKTLAKRGPSTHDPDVWSGRALQEGFVELAVSGLASMYPAFDLELDGLLAIMENSAPASSLADRPQRAIRVTRVRRRREDRTSISFHPLADLGR
jgi:hypothetical protein